MDNVFPGFSQEEIQKIAEFKRFEERFSGDPEFRRLTFECPERRADLLADFGVHLEQLPECKPLWKHLDANDHYHLKPDDLADYPEISLFMKWKSHFSTVKDKLEELSNAVDNRPLASWRKRHTQRFMSQTGMSRGSVIFPVFCFELNKGCSVGCWFCGFSAERLQGLYSYNPQNAKLWNEILAASVEFAGNAAKFSFCYHATEPLDNPDYLSFLKDYYAQCGLYPQTTTAVPLREPEITRKILALRESNPFIMDRFSVLTLKQLHKIHQLFTPYELRFVELILQNKESLYQKTGSGRALRHPEKLAENSEYAHYFNDSGKTMDPQSIDCVCGFLVNMVEQRIKCTSPCPSSERNPNGYRIHAEATFRDASEYRGILECMLKEQMPETPIWEEPLSFRPDLRYQPFENGFNLASQAYRHTINGESWYSALGALIDQGKNTQGEIITQLGIQGVSLLEVKSIVKQLFDKGLLKESIDHG